MTICNWCEKEHEKPTKLKRNLSISPDEARYIYLPGGLVIHENCVLPMFAVFKKLVLDASKKEAEKTNAK